MQCYHIFSDTTRDVYLSKNHYGSYSPQMVPTNPLAHGLIGPNDQKRNWTSGTGVTAQMMGEGGHLLCSIKAASQNNEIGQ